MDESKLALLNTSILTSFGTYTYTRITLDAARALIHQFKQDGKTIQSAIGHLATADLLSELLGYRVVVNRMAFEHTVETVALVFKLKRRPPQGKALSSEEMQAIGYEFGLLRKLD